jgi:hypothetical protein
LVVEVRRLRTISRQVPEPAALITHRGENVRHRAIAFRPMTIARLPRVAHFFRLAGRAVDPAYCRESKRK